MNISKLKTAYLCSFKPTHLKLILNKPVTLILLLKNCENISNSSLNNNFYRILKDSLKNINIYA